MASAVTPTWEEDTSDVHRNTDFERDRKAADVGFNTQKGTSIKAYQQTLAI
jgi:hypothetical protein